MAGDFEKLAYEEAVRGLDKQEGLLEALRTRTGVLMAASFVAASLLGQRAVQDPGPRSLAISALVSLVVSMGAGIFILLPKRNRAVPTAVDFYVGSYALRGDMAATSRRLAYDIDCVWDANEKEILRLSRVFDARLGLSEPDAPLRLDRNARLHRSRFRVGIGFRP